MHWLLELIRDRWDEVLARPTGPMAFRFYLQPVVAVLLAVRDGIRDAHVGRLPYFAALFTEREQRRQRLREGWKSVGKVFIVSLVLDNVYQIVVLRGLRPLEGLIVAALLAFIPYVLARGPANRIARRVLRARSHPGSSAPA